MIIQINRQNLLNNSRFGILKVNGNYFGFTLENNSKLIPTGNYTGEIYKSLKNGKDVILLHNVPERTFIEIHIANYASELEGCIAPGSYTDDEMLCSSGETFSRLMNLARLATNIEIEVL